MRYSEDPLSQRMEIVCDSLDHRIEDNEDLLRQVAVLQARIDTNKNMILRLKVSRDAIQIMLDRRDAP